MDHPEWWDLYRKVTGSDERTGRTVCQLTEDWQQDTGMEGADGIRRWCQQSKTEVMLAWAKVMAMGKKKGRFSQEIGDPIGRT